MVSIRMFFYMLSFLITACDKTNNNASGYNPSPIDSSTFKNPLLQSGPDPWVIQYNGYYYYMHTLGDRISIWKTKKITKLNNAQIKTVWTPPPTGKNNYGLNPVFEAEDNHSIHHTCF